ncbi:MAG: hypothetical protein K1X79_04620 [Oligoflexia bacterium]|nr:hypothetical protein [Oligoflexia bacterium]
MTNGDAPAESCKVAYKNEQPSQLRPRGVLLADTLKTLECALNARGLLVRRDSDIFHPLWYVAETERNIFLWKQGRSIIEQDDFEFWIDLPRLISKRLEHLQSQNDNNPFINPLWSITQESAPDRRREIDYLQTFADIVRDIETHLAALCEAGSRILSQASGRSRPKVVLPQSPLSKA